MKTTSFLVSGGVYSVANLPETVSTQYDAPPLIPSQDHTQQNVRVLPAELKREADKQGRPAVQLGRRLQGQGGARGDDDSVPSAGTYTHTASRTALGRPTQEQRMVGVPGMVLQAVPERDAYAHTDDDDGDDGRGGGGGGGGRGGGDGPGSVDRLTVKRVSSLIVERETAVIRARQRAEDARQREILVDKFKPKDDGKKAAAYHDPFASEFLYTTY